jgi:hypothetical protein
VNGSNDCSATAGSQRNHLAAIDIATGAPTSWNPDARPQSGGVVYALELPRSTGPQTTSYVPSTIYAAGAFSNLGTSSPAHARVAEINLATGAPTSWNPPVNSSSVRALTTTERHVYVGGGPGAIISSPPRNNLAEIDRFTGAVTDWNPNPDGAVEALGTTRPIGDTMPTVYVGGSFGNIGTPRQSRFRAAQVSMSDTGSVTDWDPAPGFPGSPTAGNVFALLTKPSTCITFDGAGCSTIFGGAFSHLKAMSASPVPRSRLAQTNAMNGNAEDWNPNLDKAVLTLAQSGSYLAVGGMFTTPRNLLAFYRAAP